MKIIINRQIILPALQHIIGVIERRQTLPILSNVLIRCESSTLTLLATDLELELIYSTDQQQLDDFEITLPARKLFDICKALVEDCDIEFLIEATQTTLVAGRSRFVLGSLPASDYPSLEALEFDHELQLPQKVLKNLIDNTAFAMAQQDVRYYLNGLLVEINPQHIRIVATDGHRLALSEIENEFSDFPAKQFILPRKAVLELSKLLEAVDAPVKLAFNPNHIRISTEQLQFTSKLIDGKFPDYNRVIPMDSNKQLKATRDPLKHTLNRIAILSNEKFRGIRLILSENHLKIQANNPDHEEAEEEIDVEYQEESFEIGFNVTYILDVLNVIKSDQIIFNLKDGNSSCVITSDSDESSKFVVMPMRL